ncbi:hypothetical protein TEA_021103 [Camellia sinensis var. sinensis]|uniref:P-type ATPase A domain-containing protein n=1 Tax=Camellia sinensis var. sinensis TaxID=542762 RepID=A0A4S4DCK3_CAMSN|nr:hypothetical protein TEA_021103 [Camellia sinensis var. sinensis]
MEDKLETICMSRSIIHNYDGISVSDYKQSLQFQNLNEEKQNIHLEVIRGGRRLEISIFDIVVGDVVPLEIGDQVPADGILIFGHSLAIDESSMTGESKTVDKSSKAPFLMSGCKVADGCGTMLVTSVGINTEWGLLMASISEDTGEETPLQMTVVEAYVGGKKIDPADNEAALPPMVKSLLIESIAQNTTGSVFVPEGGGKYEVAGSPTEKAILQWGLDLGMNFDAIRSNSSIIHVFPFNSEKKRGGVALKLYYMENLYILVVGHGTLSLQQLYKLNLCDPYSTSYNLLGQCLTIDVFSITPFSCPDSEVHLHWKGAAEIVLASCTRFIDTNDHFIPMDDDKVKQFQRDIEDMAARSLRCVSIAYRSYEMENTPSDEEELAHWEIPENDLVLLAIVGLKDPCRPGVKDAVQLCTNAGVKVRMVTGDNLRTGIAIALECGILVSGADATQPNIIEGKEFRALSEVRRQEIAEKISVMGRSSPSDKLLLVQTLRKKGHVVAVTGDGTNDAPALHEADIGLAMGIQGTEVAKESSDIIILDDKFASVVKEGVLEYVPRRLELPHLYWSPVSLSLIPGF